MLSKKQCKGIGRAKGFAACGSIVEATKRKYGLCFACYKRWLLTTEQGAQVLKNHTLSAKKRVKQQRSKDWSKRKEALRKKTETANQYRMRVVQPLVNKLAREIDRGQPCICLQSHVTHYDAGHYYSVGSNLTLALNLHNIHRQSVQSNRHKSGDMLLFARGLQLVYGSDYLAFINSMAGQQPLKLSKAELSVVAGRVQRLLSRLQGASGVLSPRERIHFRNLANRYIGIYDDKYSQYRGGG